MNVRSGISRLVAVERGLVAGQRIAVFTNQTGVLPDLRSTLDALADTTWTADATRLRARSDRANLYPRSKEGAS